MIRAIKLSISFFLLFNFCFLIPVSAQPKSISVNKPAAVTAKLITTFANYKTGAKISVVDLKKLIKTNPALVLKDDKGNAYTIVSFEFSWRQKSVADDVETGKPKTSYTAVGGKINGSQLNEDWIEEINETLHAGDQFNFISIIYFEKKTNKTYLGPDLKIDVTN